MSAGVSAAATYGAPGGDGGFPPATGSGEEVAAPNVPVFNLANILTVFRIVLVPFFLVALFVADGQSTLWRLTAGVIFAVAAITDRFDGQLARKYGWVTDFGKIADPIADKALMGAALVGLSVLGELSWWITGVILFRELGITVLRFWVIRHGVIAASRGGKIKTFVQTLAIGLYVLPMPQWLDLFSTSMMWLALVITLVTGVDYVVQALRVRAQGLRLAAAGSDVRPH